MHSVRTQHVRGSFSSLYGPDASSSSTQLTHGEEGSTPVRGVSRNTAALDRARASHMAPIAISRNPFFDAFGVDHDSSFDDLFKGQAVEEDDRL